MKKKPDGRGLKPHPCEASTHIVCHIFLEKEGQKYVPEGNNRTIPAFQARNIHFRKGHCVCEEQCHNRCQQERKQ